LGRDGTVFVVSNGVAWHAGATINDNIYGNYNSLGIEAENTGTGQAWPEVQVNAYAKLCALLCKHYGLSVDRVKGHKEICAPAGRKVDPANLPGDMNGLRSRVTGYMTGGNAGTPPATTKDGLELMQTYRVTKSANTTAVRIRLPGGPNAKLIIRPAEEGGVDAVFLGNIYAWGSDKSGVGGNPKNIPGYNIKVVYSREVPLANAVWADVEYSSNADFDIDVIG
jgi:lysozyme